MGKDQELLEAARNGNVPVVEKILSQRAKRSGPLARWVLQNTLSLCLRSNSFRTLSYGFSGSNSVKLSFYNS